MELTEENIIRIVKPYLENCAMAGRDAYGDYIEKMAKGIAKNILEIKEKDIEKVFIDGQNNILENNNR